MTQKKPKECLVIIDVQKGFLKKGAKRIPEKIKTLIMAKDFNNIVATKFINSKNTPHFQFTHWDGMLDKKSQELHPYINFISTRVFEKEINSCFTEEFLNFVKDEQFDKLYFVGIDTDCCVMKSAYDCFDLKIPFEVLTYYCASSGGIELHKKACHIMRRNLGQCIN